MAGIHQETEGLLSPWIRNIRLNKVASIIPNGGVVLDLACGNGFLSKLLPSDCKYYGVDRIRPSDLGAFTDFMHLDLSHEDAIEEIQEWLPQKPDIISCLAFLEHIPDPSAFITKAATLCGKTGKIIGTTPHPRGRNLHDFLAKLFLCSRSGAKEHETFLERKDLENLAQAANGALIDYRQFLFGLNQLFVLEFSDINDS